MGKAQIVVGDYSGRPVTRPTVAEVAASYRDNPPWPDAEEVVALDDGSVAVRGDDGRWYHEGPDGRADTDRPADV